MQPHPSLVMMYRDMDESVARLQAKHIHRLPSPTPWSAVRASVGNAFIAIGTRIAPMPRPTSPGATIQPAVVPGPWRSGM